MDEPTPLLLNEAQLILAEKRTILATMRTGLAILALPMTIIGLLVAFSKQSDLCAGLATLGAYLILRAVVRLHRAERELRRLKASAPSLAQFLG
jgi:uncharacterized membrane protein YidH (DUF202 family)